MWIGWYAELQYCKSLIKGDFLPFINYVQNEKDTLYYSLFALVNSLLCG